MAETWVLNAGANTTKLTNTNVNFTSNNQSFKGIGAAYAPSYGPFEIRYYQTTIFTSGTQVKTEDGTWVDNAYRTIVFDEPVTDTTLLTWLQANGTKQVNLHDQAEQCITNAYTAIGNKSGTIPTNKNLQNLKSAIESISTGIDTSDGNIEPTTVLKGYKGYAKGVAVNGVIETYDGTVEDVVSGETWVFNLTPSFSFSPTTQIYEANFICNGISYSRIEINNPTHDDLEAMYFDTTAVLNTSKTWINETYRTIVLEQPATGDLLTMLQKAAVKQ